MDASAKETANTVDFHHYPSVVEAFNNLNASLTNPKNPYISALHLTDLFKLVVLSVLDKLDGSGVTALPFSFGNKYTDGHWAGLSTKEFVNEHGETLWPDRDRGKEVEEELKEALKKFLLAIMGVQARREDIGVEIRDLTSRLVVQGTSATTDAQVQGRRGSDQLVANSGWLMRCKHCLERFPSFGAMLAHSSEAHPRES